MEDANRQRIDEIYEQIAKIKDREISLDLLKMARNCENILTQVSRESVVCRNRKSVTDRYTELLQKYNTSVENLEQYVTFAILMDG